MFDTRLQGPPLLTGRASLRIAKRLRLLGFTPGAVPTSFLIGGKDNRNRLLAGELDRAQAWGRQLAAAVPAEAATDRDG